MDDPRGDERLAISERPELPEPFGYALSSEQSTQCRSYRERFAGQDVNVVVSADEVAFIEHVAHVDLRVEAAAPVINRRVHYTIGGQLERIAVGQIALLVGVVPSAEAKAQALERAVLQRVFRPRAEAVFRRVPQTRADQQRTVLGDFGVQVSVKLARNSKGRFS